MSEKRRVVLIAGPTASGKSALAIAKANEIGGIIVNTDSMQVYDVLSVLTARPQLNDLTEAEHQLYGFVSPLQGYSTGGWLDAVRALIADTSALGTPLVFVGGTGLYFDALINGIAKIPSVPPEYVRAAELELEGLDRTARAKLFLNKDPLMAARLSEPDRQRVARALSVLAATGKSLAEWQDQKQVGLLEEFDVEKYVIDPDREVLRARIADRFAFMLDNGAIEEVDALMALRLNPGLPALKAIGVRQIADWQAGRITRQQALEASVIATAQYAKRQRTWLRNRMADWPRM